MNVAKNSISTPPEQSHDPSSISVVVDKNANIASSKGSVQTPIQCPEPLNHNVEMTEQKYREWLYVQFFPVFKPFEANGGIPTNKFVTIFQFNSFGLPRDKWSRFLIKMDANKDGKVSYMEFYNAMISTRRSDLTRRDRFAIETLLAMNPQLRTNERKRRVREDALRDCPLRNQQMLAGQSTSHQNQMIRSVGSAVDPFTSTSTSAQNDKEFGFGGGDKQPEIKIIKNSDQTGYDDEEIPESYLDAYNCRPPPIFIPIVCLVQLIVFIVYAIELKKRSANDPKNTLTWTQGYPYWSPLLYDCRRRREAWRYLTYMLIHQGIHHILFNLIVTLALGLPIEVVHKLWRVAPVYFIGVLAGSLCSSIWDPDTNLVGSSGGAYALIGAHYAIVIMNWKEMQHEWLNCKESILGFFLSGVVRLVVLTLMIGLDFGVALYQRINYTGENSVSFSGHLGGFLIGLLVGIPVLRNIKKKPWEMILFWISLSLLICLFIFAILWNIFYQGFPKQEI